MRWPILVVVMLSTVGCGAEPARQTEGDFTPPADYDYCTDALNIAAFASWQCGDQMVLPDLPSDEIQDEVLSYLLVTYDSPDIVDFDTAPVTIARVACLPAIHSYPDPALDCATGLACLSGNGITFPDPWPDTLYADQPTRCGGPRSEGWDAR